VLKEKVISKIEKGSKINKLKMNKLFIADKNKQKDEATVRVSH